jgi:hypothetical protein
LTLEQGRRKAIEEVEHALRVNWNVPQQHAGYLVSDLRTMTGLRNTALNRYAKEAGVETPRRGKKDFRYSVEAVRKILARIAEGATEQRLKERCNEALQALPKITS